MTYFHCNNIFLHVQAFRGKFINLLYWDGTGLQSRLYAGVQCLVPQRDCASLTWQRGGSHCLCFA